ncbi:hypothetical protein TBLA_0A01510 [Henningerozyma blattae CBS 6284]|uniref:DNA replication regulator Sld3 C-terminal domain-containing protein n=1 Tax=Henningerozyma blattae (strain ATCC 34711 / CBS 6284 / DSM 70876 / NBRC 10599 / NRRL Y-10934 / UCD 77-7) TaxID=1071380 RepID=I2GUZ8_HENB6|nr:hypothetical protein TBLA_0A01510 [Tetrapisispora blattae CBS 6284]CCH57950.1 hypothetical protein TBLA_0A01510 [Tetrapisispora blattae CBS 6284]
MEECELVAILDTQTNLHVSKTSSDFNIIETASLCSSLKLHNINCPNNDKLILKSLSLDNKMLNQYKLVERYTNDLWLVWNISLNESTIDCQNYKEKLSKNNAPIEIIDYSKLEDPKKLLAIWQETSKSISKLKKKDYIESTIDMTPPDCPVSTNSQVQKYKDPSSYFKSKYYETLFWTNIQLAYFVKSNMIRFKNMCLSTAKDSTIINSILNEQCLNKPNFDDRPDNIITSWEKNEFSKEPLTIALSKLQISKNSDELSQARINDFITIIKAREIKLQIILLLELIDISKIDKNFEDFDKRYKKNLKKRSINITRKDTRFLGRRQKIKSKKKVHNLSLPVKGSTNDKNLSLDYCEQLDLYLDKLSILDVILSIFTSQIDKEDIQDKLIENKYNLMNHNKETSSIGYIKYVIIPYYGKKLPNAVKFIIKKIKGVNLMQKRPKKEIQKVQTNKYHSDVVIEHNDTVSDSIISGKTSSTQSGSRKRYSLHNPALSSTTAGTLTMENLNNRTKSTLNELLETSSSHSSSRKLTNNLRTNSDLSILQKRQLSVSELSMNSSTISNRNKNNVGNKNIFQQHSFKRVGKMKNTSILSAQQSTDLGTPTKDHESDIQVLATPAVNLKTTTTSTRKRAFLENVIISPLLTTHGVTSPEDKKKKVRRRLFGP